jgi:1-acyl-sn-glycerol-3-phosphate acyltransferase
MNPWLPFCLAILLLSIPGFPRGSSRAGRDVDPMPEMRGLLGVLHRFFRLYCGLWHQLRTDRWAPLPETGPAILISNHTCGIDHMLLQSSSRRLLGFMIAREYYDAPWLHWICSFIGCIPVNRDGRDLAAIRAGLRALGEGRVLPIFPEGTIIPESGGRLGPLKPGTAYIAIRAGVPVVPAYIIGTPPTDEIFRSLAMPSRARVYYGEPIELSDIARDQAGDKAVQAVVIGRFQSALLALQARAFADEDGGDDSLD